MLASELWGVNWLCPQTPTHYNLHKLNSTRKKLWRDVSKKKWQVVKPDAAPWEESSYRTHEAVVFSWKYYYENTYYTLCLKSSVISPGEPGSNPDWGPARHRLFAGVTRFFLVWLWRIDRSSILVGKLLLGRSCTLACCLNVEDLNLATPAKKNYTLCIVGLRDYHTSGL